MRLLVAFLFGIAPAFASESLPVSEGQRYDAARAPLIRLGYRPAGRHGRMPGHPEAAKCMRDGFCIMRWKRGATVLEIGIHGNPSAIESVRQCSGKRLGPPLLPSGLFGSGPRGARHRARVNALLERED